MFLSSPDFKSPADGVDFDVVAEAFSQQEAVLRGTTPMLDRASGQIPGLSNASSLTAFHQEGGNLHAPSPAYDFIPPNLISLFVTDMGGHTPSYVYRLLTEYYSREDYSLVKDVLGAGR